MSATQLAADAAGSAAAARLRMLEMERQIILHLHIEHGFGRRRIAQRLGINESSVRQVIAEYKEGT